MAGRVEDIESHSQIDGTLPNQPFSEEELKTMGVLDPSDTLFAISIFLGSQRGGAETFIEGYSVTFQNPSGEISEIKFLRKSIVTFGDIDQKIRSREEKRRYLSERGIRVPRFFGTKSGDIFEEFIESPVDVSSIVRSIYSNGQMNEDLIGQLSKIASVLDGEGFRPVSPGFLGDLVFDGKVFYFVDFGSDLGPPNPSQPNSVSINFLLGAFHNPEVRELLLKDYQAEL